MQRRPPWRPGACAAEGCVAAADLLPRRLLAAALAAILFAWAPAQVAAQTERSQQKQAAEAERAALREKLAALKREIDRTESAHERAADALAASEAAISDANRTLRQLTQEQGQTAARLAALVKEHAGLTREAETRNRQLGKLLREHYAAGSDDRLRLLLSGENPNRISRELHYLGYVSQAQARLIETLRANLEGIEKNRADTRNAQLELEEIAQEQRDQRALLEKEKANRAHLLAQLAGKLADQRKEAGNLRQDEQRMSSLVAKLARLIEEQRKAEQAQAERRRQAALAREERARQERARQLAARQQAAKAAAEAAPGRKPAFPDPIEDDENPEKSTAQNELAPPPAVQSDFFPESFAALRGKLAPPLRGELAGRYGAKRGDGPSWKGLFIRAPEGSEVKAVAGGRVVFAEWLRGFGNLIIIDHGNQYMTIYGNNQALLKRAGDPVKGGDAIASAGNSGGNEQSGLYFEMRHQGRAFDPLDWVTFR